MKSWSRSKHFLFHVFLGDPILMLNTSVRAVMLTYEKWQAGPDTSIGPPTPVSLHTLVGMTIQN
jgi:hypothetical protein